MSKYIKGDKVVMKITDRFKNAYGHEYYSILDSVYSTEFIDEKSEPLRNYTEPLEAKIKRQAAEITRLLRENKELKNEAEEEYRLGANAEYERWKEHSSRIRAEGQNEAWELAKKIVLKNGYSSYDLHEIFNCCGSHQALENYTYPEAAAKVAEWEKAKEIKVGDVVRDKCDTSSKFCVTQIDYCDGQLYGVGRYGLTYSNQDPEYWEKTGHHIDIDSFLKQIRGEQE